MDRIPDAALHEKRRDSTVGCLSLALTQEERITVLLLCAMAGRSGPSFFRAGAVMLAASAVDAMLKAKGYKEGSLNSRLEKAVADHLITKEMRQWAHEVRLDANEQRHADEDYKIPAETDAHTVIEFT